MSILKPKIIQRPSPNRWRSRYGFKVKGVVIHITDGALLGALSWLSNPRAQVSAHYVVAKNGTVYQLVDEAHTAWHAGRVRGAKWRGLIPGKNPNLYTIGIEVEGKGTDKFTKEQYLSVCWLLRDISKRHGLPLNEDTVINHRDIFNGKTCPGVHNGANIVLEVNKVLD